MKNSIYEETISILNSRIADGEVKSFKVTGETYEKITSTLQQAQKQEKLLDLYREYFRLSSLPKPPISVYVYNRLLEIKNEIKELENE